MYTVHVRRTTYVFSVQYDWAGCAWNSSILIGLYQLPIILLAVYFQVAVSGAVEAVLLVLGAWNTLDICVCILILAVYVL